MSYEIWTAHRYGALFGQPESKLQDGLSESQAAEELRRDHKMALHSLLVVQGEQATRANAWLKTYESRAR